jgi:transposase
MVGGTISPHDNGWGGGRAAAVLSFLTGTCKHHRIDPFAYIQDILRRLAYHPADQLAELLPNARFAAHPPARRKGAA